MVRSLIAALVAVGCSPRSPRCKLCITLRYLPPCAHRAGHPSSTSRHHLHVLSNRHNPPSLYSLVRVVGQRVALGRQLLLGKVRASCHPVVRVAGAPLHGDAVAAGGPKKDRQWAGSGLSEAPPRALGSIAHVSATAQDRTASLHAQRVLLAGCGTPSPQPRPAHSHAAGAGQRNVVQDLAAAKPRLGSQPGLLVAAARSPGHQVLVGVAAQRTGPPAPCWLAW